MAKTPTFDPEFLKNLHTQLNQMAEEIEPPSRLSPQNLDELLDLRPTESGMARHMPLVRFVGVAACFALVVALLVTLNPGQFSSSSSLAGGLSSDGMDAAPSSAMQSAETAGDTGAGLFSAESAVAADEEPTARALLLENLIANTSAYMNTEALAALSIDQYALSQGHLYNAAADGVEPGRLMTADERFLYLADDHYVDIFTADGLSEVLRIPMRSETVNALFAVGGQLIVVASSDGADTGVPYTRLVVYDVTAEGLSIQRREFVQEGWYLAASLYESGQLMLVTQKRIDIAVLAADSAGADTDPFLPRVSQTRGPGALVPIAESDIHIPDHDAMPQYTVVSLFNTANVRQDAQSFALLGEAYHVYTAQQALYIAGKMPLTNETALARVELWDGRAFVSETLVSGRLLSTGSLLEEAGMCKAVFTADAGRTARYTTYSVVMYPLRQMELGTEESALLDVLMLGDTLYALPRDSGDKVQIYDTAALSEPLVGTAPGHILEGLLVPVREGIYLGVSGGDGPLTVSTYDLRDKLAPATVQTLTFAKSGSSAAFTDIRTLAVDAEAGLVFVPVELSAYKGQDLSGLFAFSVGRSGGLELRREMHDTETVRAALVRDGLVYRATKARVTALRIPAFTAAGAHTFPTQPE